MLLFHFTLLVSCYHVMSQPDDKCKFVNFSCEAGLSKTSQEFSLIEICDPLLDPAVAGRCNFIHSGGRPVGFKCPDVFGLKTALLCIPGDIPHTTDYCFCEGLPTIRIAEVPDISFREKAHSVTEDDQTVSVCVVAGKLAEDILPLKVAISTTNDTAKSGIDFIGVNNEISFTQSNQEHCVDITILKDASDEGEESFTVELTLKYAPFDIPLDSSTVSIGDTDIVGVGFEHEVYAEVVPEGVGNFTICVITNVTLNGHRTASAVLHTEDVSAEAGADYALTHEPIVFRINGDSRTCVNISIFEDKLSKEHYEAFLIRLTSTDAPVFADTVIVLIEDEDPEFYPFGSDEGDKKLLPGIVINDTISSPLKLPSKFPFFGRDEYKLYVNLNGVLSFKEKFNIPHPLPFPYKSLALISPYWGNYDTSRNGDVYYRTTKDSTLLKRAQYHLQSIFTSARDFSPSYLVIVTWDRVPELGLAGNPKLTNEFQVVLATDGTKSFVLFIYGDVTWGRAGIGFNAGDGKRSYTLPGSLDESTQEVEESSNVGVEGVYMYRVDQNEIINPEDCKDVEERESHCTKQNSVQIGFEQPSYTVHEGDKSVTVCAVKTAGDIVTPVPVTVFTVDGLSAQAGEDFMKQKTELMFTKTSPRACTKVDLIADHEREPTESFAVAMVTLHMRTVTLKPQFAFVTILDDDEGKTSSGWGTSTVILLGIITAIAVVYYFMGQNKDEGKKEK